MKTKKDRAVVLIVLLAMLFVAAALVVSIGMYGCANQTATQQIVQELDGKQLSPIEKAGIISNATYYDALKFYNDTKAAFTKQVASFPPAAQQDPAVRKWVQSVDKSFAIASDILAKWKDAKSLIEYKDNSAKWEEIAGKLIDAGMMLLTK